MDNTSRVRIIDCDWSVEETAGAIKDTGIKTVIRYYSGDNAHAGKILSPRELVALDAQGLSVAVVFQDGNNFPDYFDDPQKKIRDVKAALRNAEILNQPAGSAIYFGIDFNINTRRKKNQQGHFYRDANGDWVTESSPAIQAANEPLVLAYFEHAHAQLSARGYKVGVYGCGRVAEMLSVPGQELAEFFWLSASVSYVGTAGFYNPPSSNWHLFQNKTEIPSDLIPPTYIDKDGHRKPMDPDVRRIDTDVLNGRFEYFGQWKKDGSMPPHPTADSKLVLAHRGFSKVGRHQVANVYSQPDTRASHVGSGVGYGRNVRFLGVPQNGFVAVSLAESDNVDGYCQTADLTADLNTMPLW